MNNSYYTCSRGYIVDLCAIETKLYFFSLMMINLSQPEKVGHGLLKIFFKNGLDGTCYSLKALSCTDKRTLVQIWMQPKHSRHSISGSINVSFVCILVRRGLGEALHTSWKWKMLCFTEKRLWRSGFFFNWGLHTSTWGLTNRRRSMERVSSGPHIHIPPSSVSSPPPQTQTSNEITLHMYNKAKHSCLSCWP